MNVAEDIGSGSSGTPANAPTSPGTPVGAPIEEPGGATVLPGTPIGSPVPVTTTPPTSVEESNDSSSSGFPIEETAPGDNVYQSDSDYTIGTSDGGPGVWADEPIPIKGAEYQQQVTGAPPGTAYEVEGVKFDGYDPERDVLIDAKDWDTWPSRDSNGVYHDFALDSVIDQAEAQVVAANGTAIEWHVPTPEKAEELQDILEEAGITGITVVVTPKP
jgi:hypothetical protein